MNALVAAVLAYALSTDGDDAAKTHAVLEVESQAPRLIELSRSIWEFAETALKESRSSAALAEYAAEEGFRVERGVAGMPTAFVATYGEGTPVIGIMGEFDALPGLSQQTVPRRDVLAEGRPGHGCGHNLFGPASLGAAIAVRRLIEAGELSGTIRFYGTPAEEAVGGKLYMAREGLFDDVDVAIAWHPSSEIRSDTGGSQALVDFIVEFHGRAAHAAYDPWNGASALDGLELFTFALNQMREHVRPTVRMHYVIQNGGDVPNVVPDYAKLWCWIRDSRHEEVDRLIERARKITEGASLAAGVTGALTIQSGDYEMLVNMAGQRAVQANLEALGAIAFTSAEQEFAREIQRATGVPEVGLNAEVEPLADSPTDPDGGSTDVADVSWVTPTLHLTVTTAPVGAPWHAWPVVACAGMSIGHKGMMHASKALAMTMVDLFRDAELRQAIRAEFEEKTAGHTYRGYIPDGPPPLPTE